jgi:hypothetical protein
MRFILYHSQARYSLQVAEVGLHNPSSFSECDICKSISRRQQVNRHVGTFLLFGSSGRTTDTVFRPWRPLDSHGLRCRSLTYCNKTNSGVSLLLTTSLSLVTTQKQSLTLRTTPPSRLTPPVLLISSYPRLIPCNSKKTEGVQTDIISTVAFPL